MPKKLLLQLIFLFYYLMDYSDTLLINNDVTENSEFGCQWSGGNYESGVSCVCQQNAKEFYIQENTIPAFDTTVIKITDCNEVRFGSRAVNNMRRLRRIELTNIKNLTFEDSGLIWYSYVQVNNDYYNLRQSIPTLKIKIENCQVNKISSYTFQGQISSITFINSNIGDIHPFAFSSLTYTEEINFSKVKFNTVQQQSFKKFVTDNLIIIDSIFTNLPSRLFNNVTVFDTFTIKNTSFNHIKSNAFLIENPKKFEILNSKINELEGEGFKVMTRGSILIQHNIFNVTHSGAFLGFTLSKEVTSTEEILFDANIFYTLSRNSLNSKISNFRVKFVNTIIKEDCNCKVTNYNLENNDDEDGFYCMFQNKSVSIKEFKSHNCSILDGYSTIIIVVGVVLILFILISIALIFYFRRMCTEKTEYLTDKNGKPLNLIMPDGRTYRETELHVVVERADLLTTDL